MKLQDAEQLANRILGAVEPYAVKVAVAGSVRRRRPEPNDIDIVVIPRPLMWDSMISMVANFDPSDILKKGALLSTVTIYPSRWSMQIPNMPSITVDFYVSTPETWGILLLIRTGSKEHNISLCSRAREMGLMLSAARGVIWHGKVIASRTEADIFTTLGLPYIEPQNREV